MKKAFVFFLTSCLLLVLSGCAAKELELVSEVPYIYMPAVDDAEWGQVLSQANNYTRADRLITKEYALSVFKGGAIVGSWAKGSWYSGMAVSQLHLKYTYGLEVLRKQGDGRYYAAYKIREGGWFFVFLCDDEENTTGIPFVVNSHSLYVSDALNKAAIRNVKVGDSRAAVEAADPVAAVRGAVGRNVFNRLDSEGRSNYTLHWCDNEIYIFTYDETGETVTGVEHYPDGRVPSSVDGWYFDYNLRLVDRLFAC